MPGTLVTDAIKPTLLDGTNLTATGDGAAVEVGFPQWVRAKLVLGTVTGTNPTLALKIQGCDASAFSTGVVDYGAFPEKVGTDDAVTRWLSLCVQHKYVRASYVIAGTTPVFPATLTLEEEDYQRSPGDTA